MSDHESDAREEAAFRASLTPEPIVPNDIEVGWNAGQRDFEDQAILAAAGLKETNPKDAVGVRKWRQYTTVPSLVMAEVGVGMLEGAMKYGRHNYRVAGVRASVYVDAAKGHIDQWWEGEDIDPDSGLSHVTKAICSLVVLRDAMIQDMLSDDRPPKAKLDKVRLQLQATVEDLFDRYPEPVAPFTQQGLPVKVAP